MVLGLNCFWMMFCLFRFGFFGSWDLYFIFDGFFFPLFLLGFFLNLMEWL